MNGLDHVAILVSDLDAAVKLYRDVYGLELAEIEEAPSEKVRVAIFGHGRGRIELVSPSGPDSPMAKAIEKRGEGLHHVCFETPDIAKALTVLHEMGVELLDSTPRVGLAGQIAFVHPRACGGVLVELATPSGASSEPAGSRGSNVAYSRPDGGSMSVVASL